MFSNVLLQYSTISQWVLFLGISLMLFGWFERKDKVLLYGQIIFLILGGFALWIVCSGQINIPPISDTKLSKEMKILGFFQGILLLVVIDLIALALKIFKLRFQKACNMIVILLAMMLFFMVFNILQTPVK